MAKISGGCLCGAVRYECTGAAVITAMCHCTHCQKQSGSAFSINVGFPKGALQFVKGTPATYRDVGTSGLPVHRHFCADCGSPIYSAVDAMPQLDFIKAGTLDDASWVSPTLNLWCASAQSWVAHPEGVPKFPQEPVELAF